MKKQTNFRLEVDSLEALERASSVLNKKIGVNAFDRTKVLEMLIKLYLPRLLEEQ